LVKLNFGLVCFGPLFVRQEELEGLFYIYHDPDGYRD